MKPRNRGLKPKEHEVQSAIVQTLRLAGAIVKETTAYKQKGKSGVDPGIPDLLVFHPLRPRIYLGLEIKRDSKSPLSEAQSVAVERQEYQVVTAPRHALAALIEFLQDAPGTAEAIGKALHIKSQLEALSG